MKRPILWTTIFMICGIYMRLGISKVICLVSFLFLLFFLFRFVINKKKPAYLLLLFFVPLGFFSAGGALAGRAEPFDKNRNRRGHNSGRRRNHLRQSEADPSL